MPRPLGDGVTTTLRDVVDEFIWAGAELDSVPLHTTTPIGVLLGPTAWGALKACVAVSCDFCVYSINDFVGVADSDGSRFQSRRSLSFES
jgi:hypothetical protein